MPGFMMCYGSCIACRKPIQFNPRYVPSITVNGEKEPLCQSCHARWNQIHRTSQGLDPDPLHPMAYEPEPEGGQLP